MKTLIVNAPAELRDALDPIRGKVALIRHIAAFRPGDIDTTLASAKTAMRALARRWLWLHDESFEAAGWRDVVPYPVDYRMGSFTGGIGWDFSSNLEDLNTSIKEWVGRLAYWLTGR